MTVNCTVKCTQVDVNFTSQNTADTDYQIIVGLYCGMDEVEVLPFIYIHFELGNSAIARSGSLG